MKKFLIVAVTCLLLVGCGMKGAFAYEFSKDCPYVIVDVQTIGEVKLYFPSNQIDLLQISQDDNSIVNISNGSVYGYFSRSSTDYRVTFPTFDIPTYRSTSGTSMQTTDFIIRSIIDTNISHFKDDHLKTPMDYIEEFADDRFILITLILIFGIGVLQWLKH